MGEEALVPPAQPVTDEERARNADPTKPAAVVVSPTPKVTVSSDGLIYGRDPKTGKMVVVADYPSEVWGDPGRRTPVLPTGQATPVEAMDRLRAAREAAGFGATLPSMLPKDDGGITADPSNVARPGAAADIRLKVGPITKAEVDALEAEPKKP